MFRLDLQEIWEASYYDVVGTLKVSVIHSIAWSLWQFRKYSSTTGDKTFPQANVYCLYWVLPLWLWAKQMTKFLVRLQCMQLCMQLYIWSGSNVCSYNGKLHYNIACTLALVIIPFARHKFTFTINVYAVGIIINVFHNREMLKISLNFNAYLQRKNHLLFAYYQKNFWAFVFLFVCPRALLFSLTIDNGYKFL